MPRKYKSRFPRRRYGRTKRTFQSKWSNKKSKSLLRRAVKKGSQHLALYSQPGAGGVVQPFPPNLWTVLTYTVTRQYTTSGIAGAIAAPLQIRANSIYDPEVAVGGGQPRYTDSLLGDNNSTAPYRNYRVHASSIKVTLWKGGTTYTENDLLYIIPSRATVSNPSTENEVVERPYSKTVPATAMYSGYPRTLKHFTKMKWHLGHKDLADVDNSSADFGHNPNEQIYWNIGVCDVSQVAPAAHNVQLQISVRYFVQFYTLSDVADS